jgi:hypothetical protein
VFGRKKEIDHPSLGRLRFMGDYWEGELDFPDRSEALSVTIDAPESGPTEAQVALFHDLVADQNGLFQRLRPLLEAELETWTDGSPAANWADDITLTGLDLPEDGDAPQEVTYWVPAAGHWFTAVYEDGEPSSVRVDG